MAWTTMRNMNTYVSSETSTHGLSDPLADVERARRSVVEAAWQAQRWDVIRDMMKGLPPTNKEEEQ